MGCLQEDFCPHETKDEESKNKAEPKNKEAQTEHKNEDIGSKNKEELNNKEAQTDPKNDGNNIIIREEPNKKEDQTEQKNAIKVMENKKEPSDKEALAKNGQLITQKPPLSRSRTNADELDFDAYKNNIIRLHNDIREKHKTPKLKENEKLNDMASIYAESLVNDNQEKRDYEINIYNDEIVGENIIISESKRPEDAFKKILDEKSNYDFNRNKFSKASGHFTQAIWKDTTDIGCGFWADKRNKKYYVVLLYYPAGNIFENFSKNVISEKS